jgi:HPt (histidine-containing phosphotransfer) domain-containing protein
MDAVEMFREDAPNRLAAVRRAVNTGANGVLRRESHALAGAARSVGLVRLGEASSALQKTLDSGGEPAPGLVEQLFKLLAESMSRAMDWKIRFPAAHPDSCEAGGPR